MIYSFMLIALFVVPQSKGDKITIEGLGEIALPAAEWKVELVHHSTAAQKTPDVFVLRKVGDTIERITILRYPRELKMRAYVYCDSTADRTLFGIPGFLEPEYEKLRETTGEAKLSTKKNGTIEMVRIPTDFDAKELEVTNFYTDSNDVNWMNNGYISESDECVFVFVHTAPRVLLPETISECYLLSKLQPPK